MKQVYRRAVISALAFIIPGLVMLWVYASLGFAPWGDRTVLVSDMSSQYVEFFCALKNGDLFFSWSKVLGSGYIGVFSYYVSSPLSFLTLLVPNESMPVGLLFLTVLKIALSGLTFAIFAQRRFPGCGIPALACAVCVLSSWYISYMVESAKKSRHPHFFVSVYFHLTRCGRLSRRASFVKLWIPCQ